MDFGPDRSGWARGIPETVWWRKGESFAAFRRSARFRGTVAVEDMIETYLYRDDCLQKRGWIDQRGREKRVVMRLSGIIRSKFGHPCVTSCLPLRKLTGENHQLPFARSGIELLDTSRSQSHSELHCANENLQDGVVQPRRYPSHHLWLLDVYFPDDAVLSYLDWEETCTLDCTSGR